MSHCYALAILLLHFLSSSVLSSSGMAHDPVAIWPEGTPNSKGEGAGHVPTLTWYPAPQENNTGACVVVHPGGAYNVLADQHEGTQVARWLNSLGINAYVHHYRLKKHGYTPADALQDALQAMRLARASAAEKGYDPQRLGILGFSAGGHLSSMTTLTSSVGSSENGPTADERAARPDFAILVYPAYLYVAPETEYGVPPKPSNNVPPVFVAVSGQDPKYEMTSAKIFEHFKPAGVDVELHAFGGYGPHGLGLAQGDIAFGQWPALAHDWMRRQGVLTDLPRCDSVTLTVRLCGKNLGTWARLTPIGDQRRPVVSVKAKSPGVFEFKDPNTRPCPGEHTLSTWNYVDQEEIDVIVYDPLIKRMTIEAGKNTFEIDDFRLKMEPQKD